MKFSWDDDIPIIMENNPFMFQTTNQIIITCTEWMVLDSA
jgi:hypothetical protein